MFTTPRLLQRKQQAQNRDFCLPHLHSTPPLGSSQNIDMPFGIEKPEWRGYPMVKKF